MNRYLAPFAALLSFGLIAASVEPIAAGSLAHAPTAPVAGPRNVLLICVDDLKPVLGCYGDPNVKSPHFDRLAARGTLFERAYCNQAVCAPSRNALMTGLRPQTLGIYDLGTHFRRARPDAVTVAQYFQNAGYRTEATGKILHVGQGNHEDTASWTVPHWNPPASSFYALEENAAAYLANRAAGSPSKGPSTEVADVRDNGYGDGLVADEAIRRLERAKANPDQPFFLAVGFSKPHLPFTAPKSYWDLYDAAAFDLPSRRDPPEGAPDFAPTEWWELRNYTDIPKTGPLSDEQARHLIHGYHAATSFVDAQVGRVIERLDALGLTGNTIVVLWGDHGWHLGDHGMWAKHTNYEQAARVPLIVVAPGMKPGARTRAFVESVDLYATLAELAGLPAPAGLDGRSFVSVLQDPSAAIRDHIIHVFPRPRAKRLGRAIRNERYRLVEWKASGAAGDTAEWELYDYEAHPAETKNLAAERPEIVAQLRALLATHPEPKPQLR